MPSEPAASPFKAGGRGGPGYYVDIPAGDLMLRHVLDLYPHPNTLTALRLVEAAHNLGCGRLRTVFTVVVPL